MPVTPNQIYPTAFPMGRSAMSMESDISNLVRQGYLNQQQAGDVTGAFLNRLSPNSYQTGVGMLQQLGINPQQLSVYGGLPAAQNPTWQAAHQTAFAGPTPQNPGAGSTPDMQTQQMLARYWNPTTMGGGLGSQVSNLGVYAPPSAYNPGPPPPMPMQHAAQTAMSATPAPTMRALPQQLPSFIAAGAPTLMNASPTKGPRRLTNMSTYGTSQDQAGNLNLPGLPPQAQQDQPAQYSLADLYGIKQDNPFASATAWR